MKKFCALVLLCTVACVPSSPEKLRYRLDAAQVTQQISQSKSSGMSITVVQPTAVAGLASERIQVQSKDAKILWVDNAAWVEPLDKMLAPIMVQSLEQSRKFLRVNDDKTAGYGAQMLHTRIERFTLVQENTPYVQVALTLQWNDKNRRCNIKQTLSEVRMGMVISAFEKALGNCLDEAIAAK